mgnify:CR=1 FL=1
MKRHLDSKINQHFKKYKQVLILLGSRQVGKTTLVKKIFPLADYFLVDNEPIKRILESYDIETYKTLINKDSKEIVIDEVVGFLITMAWVPLTWQSAVIGFCLFRFFDIVKPPPIRQLDKKIPGGFGVMIDDIAAGIISSILMQLIYNQTNWLGIQISTLTAN